MAFTSKGHTQTALAEINITPLVDVVRVLLLIFMLTAPVLQSGVEVAIPKTRTVNQLTARLREFGARMDDFGRELLNAIENAAMLTPPQQPPTHVQQPVVEEPRRRAF